MPSWLADMAVGLALGMGLWCAVLLGDYINTLY